MSHTSEASGPRGLLNRTVGGVPRRPRLIAPDGIYHVTARGNRRQVIFEDDRDRRTFLSLLRRVVARRRWVCHAYCLMPNHVHLVLQTPMADLSAGIQALCGRYAEAFNRRYELDGHLFQGRFHAVAVESDWHLLELARYLALNPVKGGLCSAPADWPWSSYRALAGRQSAPGFLAVERLLGLFGTEPVRRCAAFRAFVQDAPSPRLSTSL
jgi:putative transposase